jgi:glycosyltransferase involved in cell wall biosynthesis
MEEVPLVSVCLITYNHAPFIEQAIQGVLSQEMDCSWELIIADDHSTDGTREILLQYRNRENIVLILQDENVGAARNWFDLLKAAKAEYIAYFEGDDFWHNNQKLKTQIHFLNSHAEYAICFTRGIIHNLFNNTKNEHPSINKDSAISIEEMIMNNDQLTVTSCFRNPRSFPQWFFDVPFGDWALYLFLMKDGHKAACLSEVTATYRIHKGGLHSNSHESKLTLANAYKMHLDFYSGVRKNLFPDRFSNEFNNAFSIKLRVILTLYLEEKEYRKALNITLRYFRINLDIVGLTSHLLKIVRAFIKH